jgi:Leucine-rich repeat (LRR) protein
MAVYIGKVEEDYLFDAKLQNYFRAIEMNEWKRISFYGDNIKSLPANGSLPAKGFKCGKLVSLNLAANKDLEEIPMSFLAYRYLPSIRVLDLSRTKIKLLPITIWQLELAYLDISYTQIEDLSEDIGYLLDLQFLNMCGCSKLESLPKAIGHLHELQFLNITRCSKLISIPSVIYDLKKLKYFQYNTFLI